MSNLVSALQAAGFEASEFHDPGDPSVGIYPVYGISLDGCNLEDSSLYLVQHRGLWRLEVAIEDGEFTSYPIQFPTESTFFAPYVARNVAQLRRR